jgi:outer membrane protein
MRRLTACLITLAFPALAQESLTLEQAVDLALQKHPAIEAAGQQVKAAEARIGQARSGYLPKVNYQEMAARSNNPVFVFSSLLTQHQFTEQNFNINQLNRPGFLDNFQSLVSVDQTIWDNRATKNQVKMAETGRAISAEDERRERLNTTTRVVQAYFGATLAQAALDTAQEAVKSAEADLKRAESVRAAGMSTEADVLSIRVHLADVREQQVRRAADLEVARAALNEALGLPLDTLHQLATALNPATLTTAEATTFESQALQQRPEIRQVRLAENLAEQQRSVAKSTWWPSIGARAQFEADRQTFFDKGGANWWFGATLRWNLFNGFADKEKVAEASYLAASAKAKERQLDTGLRLEVRRALASLKAANERIRLTTETVAQAEESLRITKNRYDAGMATVTDLLRTETALLDARTRRLSAVYDQRLAATSVELAAGTLSPSSEVLK